MCVQAIVESNPFGIDYNTNKEEKQIGQEYAGKLGCEYSSLVTDILHCTVH